MRRGGGAGGAEGAESEEEEEEAAGADAVKKIVLDENGYWKPLVDALRVMTPIVKLLHRSEIIGAQRSPATVAAAASALWNLSAHEGAKKMVIREKGVEALVMQLNEAEDRDAWQKCAGCLMVLAANSQQVKHLVGDEDGIRALCEIVKQSLTDGAVLKAALGALSVLSSDERNLAHMPAERHAPNCSAM